MSRRQELIAAWEANRKDYNNAMPLPTSEDLVAACRAKHCDDDAITGKRPLGPPPIAFYPDTKGFTRWHQKMQARALKARHDSVKAALKAEEWGAVGLASDCWLLAGDVDGALDVLPPPP